MRVAFVAAAWLLLAASAASSAVAAEGWKNPSPKSVWICGGEGGKLDWTLPDAELVLRAVLLDWMTNPKRRGAAYGRFADPLKPGGRDNAPRPTRLLLDRRSVPQGFRLVIPGMQVALDDRKDRVLRSSDLAIVVGCVVPHGHDAYDVGFSDAGGRIIGSAYQSYTARSENGHWVVTYVTGFDP